MVEWNVGRVIVIGTGNLAWHLVPNLQRIGLKVDVWARVKTPENDDMSKWVSSLRPPSVAFTANEYYPSVDYALPTLKKKEIAAVFLAVPDDQITPVSQELAVVFSRYTPVVHTSGATALAAIDAHFIHRAALWPIRSLKNGEPAVEWRDLPLVYSTNKRPRKGNFAAQLENWCAALSDVTYPLNDEQRAQLHLAAVFSNNFTTWLCQIAYELCHEAEVPFQALVPIIQNTFSKIDGSEPALRQTGAAIRRDHKTMDRHQQLLANHPEYQELYQRMSRLIMGEN